MDPQRRLAPTRLLAAASRYLPMALGEVSA